MKLSANSLVHSALELTCQLGKLAEEAQYEEDDPKRNVFWCVVRDCTYKIRHHAERELGTSTTDPQ